MTEKIHEGHNIHMDDYAANLEDESIVFENFIMKITIFVFAG